MLTVKATYNLLKNNNMKITKSYGWNRRDFYYDAKCEHCGHTTTNNGGYDDANYYTNVVPEIKCPICKESTNTKISDEPKTVTIPKHNHNIVM